MPGPPETTDEVRYANATGALEPDSVVLRDLVGEHKQTDFQAYFENVPGSIDPTTGLPLRAEPAVSTNSPAAKLEPPPWIKESFEITLRNHKSIPVEIRVVEHLFRWSNWEIRKPSDQFKKTDAQTIEFRVTVKPEEEKVISYTAHYTAHYW